MSAKLSNTGFLQNFRLIRSLLLIIIIAICTIFFTHDYLTTNGNIKEDLTSQNDRVSRKFTDSLNYTKHIMQYISDQIARGEKVDNKFINQLLISYRIPTNDVMVWSTFSWVDIKQRLVISSNFGIDTKNSPDMSKRDYIPRTIAQPRVFQTGTPVFGAKSHLWSIPVGLGVVDKNKKYIGSVITGIVIDGIKSKLDEVITNHAVSFALIDKRDGKLITKSDNFNEDEIKNIFDQPTKLSNKLFSYKELENYPYIIITSYSPKLFHKEIISKMVTYLILSSLFVFLVNLPLIFFRHKLITPILQLSAAANAISQDRDEDAIRLLPHTKIAEIEALSQQLKAIQEYKIRLLSAKKVQNNFFSNMSHELRTPLTGVMSYAELMKDEIYGPLGEEYKKLSEVIFKSGVHLLSLIEDLLNFSYLNSGRAKTYDEELDIRFEIQEAIDIVVTRAAKNNIKISTDFSHQKYVLKADKSMFKRILLNLLSNAITFSKPDGEIKVTTEINNLGQLRLIVIDHGIGIAAADIPLILEEYGQARDSRKVFEHQGTGLGLPISQKMIVLHRGRLRIKSVFGEGTSVIVIFPKTRLLVK